MQLNTRPVTERNSDTQVNGAIYLIKFFKVFSISILFSGVYFYSIYFPTDIP